MTITAARHRAGAVLSVLLAAQFMNNVDTAIVNVAAPDIITRLHADGGQIQLVVSGYLLAYAMLLITGARLGDIRGYRRMFLVGTVVFTVASAACGLAPSTNALIVARIVQGVGAALMVPQVLTGIQLHFPGQSRVRALALYAVALSGGAVAGQVLGGVLVDANIGGSGWRPIFLINVPIGIALLGAATVVLPPDTRSRRERLDLPGVATLSAGVLALVVPLVFGRDQGWPPWTWVLLGASPILAGAFVAVERRTAARGGYPLVNLPVIVRPAVGWGLIAQACVQASYFAVLLTLALYLQAGLGRSPLYSGLALVSWVAAFGVAGSGLRKLPASTALTVGPVGYGVLGVAYAAITATLFTGHADGPLLITLLGVGGLGLGLGINSMIARITSAATPRFAPDISGVHTTVLQIAAALGIAVFGSVWFGVVDEPGPTAATHGFAVVMVCLAGTAVAGALAAWRSVRSPLGPAAPIASTPARTGSDVAYAPVATAPRT